MGKVVSRLTRAAMAGLPGSPLLTACRACHAPGLTHHAQPVNSNFAANCPPRHDRVPRSRERARCAPADCQPLPIGRSAQPQLCAVVFSGSRSAPALRSAEPRRSLLRAGRIFRPGRPGCRNPASGPGPWHRRGGSRCGTSGRRHPGRSGWDAGRPARL